MSPKNALIIYDRTSHSIEIILLINVLRASTSGRYQTATLLLKVTYFEDIFPIIRCMPISYKHCWVDKPFIKHHKWVCDAKYIAIFHCSHVQVIFARGAISHEDVITSWNRLPHPLRAAMISISLKLSNKQSHCHWPRRSCDATLVWSNRWMGHYHKPSFYSMMTHKSASKTRPSLLQMMTCPLVGPKPFSEPILEYR